MKPFTILAAAISAVGFLTVAARVQASPMLPLAPACDQFVFTGGFSLRQTNGFQVFFSSTGTVAGGQAVAVGDDNVTKLKGPVSGRIKGRNVDFLIRWDTGGSGRYVGTAGDDGVVHGSTGGTGWDSTSRVECLTPAPAPPPSTTPPPVFPPPPDRVVPGTPPPVFPPPPADRVVPRTTTVPVPATTPTTTPVSGPPTTPVSTPRTTTPAP
jgi:hypothetical protein